MTLLTPETVLAWARTRPADEAYEYANSAACALCQFLRDNGAPAPWVTAKFWHASPLEPYRIVDPALNEAAAVEPHTFGAFVMRLEGLVGSSVAALCCGCGEDIPLTDEQRLVSGLKGWWHPECHGKATHDVNRMLALRAVAKMPAGFVR